MKTTIVILVVLGVVAAICAVMLVNLWPRIFNKVSDQPEKKEILVWVAARSIPVYSELKKEDIVEGKIDLAKEVGYYTSEDVYIKDPIYAVGKTVASEIAQGQAITKDKLITDPDRATVLKALKPGMRAYPVKLSSDQIVGGLLTPDSFVDVLVTFSTRSGPGSAVAKGEAVSTTFLEKIKVIAVKGELATRDSAEEGKTSGVRAAANNSGWTVTLLVDTVQAEALQLATERGRISLTLRNPLDDQKVNSPGTVLDTSKIGISSMFFDPPSEKDQKNTSTPDKPKGEVEVIRGNKTTFEDIKVAEEEVPAEK
jgi:pilus assembly protein CpaB